MSTPIVDRQLSLEILQVKDPCTQDWAGMAGDDRTRFCGVCSKNVYNLSAMTRAEATDLVSKAEGRLCVRFYRRADGTVVTADCSLIRKAARRTRRMLATAGAAVVAVISGITGIQLSRADSPLIIPDNSPAGQVNRAVEMGDVAEPIQGKMAAPEPPVMGGLCPPAPPATQPATTQPATQPRK